MLVVFILMLNVIILNVVMLSVVAPLERQGTKERQYIHARRRLRFCDRTHRQRKRSLRLVPEVE
jgi:hypothetical protein